jgi:catechol 2,3-dioxygenase-like lactoylglutathione lyase family enzyme
VTFNGSSFDLPVLRYRAMLHKVPAIGLSARPYFNRYTDDAMGSVSAKIAHASYEIPDLDQQVAYYTDVLGVTLIAREKDTAYLSTTIDHHSIVLRRGSEAKCTCIGFQLGPDDDLDAFEKQTNAAGVKTIRKKDSEPTISDMVCFEDTKGTIMEVFKRPEFTHQRFQTKGIVPHKLGHVAFHVADVKKATQFYCDVLGFRVSDWMGDFFSFLRCGPDHHTINLVETGSNRHFHTAFELRDWSHLQTACDLLSMNGYKLLWGPGRHGIGHNLFTYHRSPSGLITELFAELDRERRSARLLRAAPVASR